MQFRALTIERLDGAAESRGSLWLIELLVFEVICVCGSQAVQAHT
jgi:hypothetical protein